MPAFLPLALHRENKMLVNQSPTCGAQDQQKLRLPFRFAPIRSSGRRRRLATAFTGAGFAGQRLAATINLKQHHLPVCSFWPQMHWDRTLTIVMADQWQLATFARPLISVRKVPYCNPRRLIFPILNRCCLLEYTPAQPTKE